MKDIHILQSRLHEKREELTRLQMCQRQLQECLYGYECDEQLCYEPEHSKHDWHGNLSIEFDVTRENQLVTSYRRLGRGSLDDIIVRIDSKIKKTKQDIGHLSQTIAFIQSQ